MAKNCKQCGQRIDEGEGHATLNGYFCCEACAEKYAEKHPGKGIKSRLFNIILLIIFLVIMAIFFGK